MVSLELEAIHSCDTVIVWLESDNAIQCCDIVVIIVFVSLRLSHRSLAHIHSHPLVVHSSYTSTHIHSSYTHHTLIIHTYMHHIVASWVLFVLLESDSVLLPRGIDVISWFVVSLPRGIDVISWFVVSNWVCSFRWCHEWCMNVFVDLGCVLWCDVGGVVWMLHSVDVCGCVWVCVCVYVCM